MILLMIMLVVVSGGTIFIADKMCIRDRYEVALGADIGAIAEAHHYVEKVVTGELPFLLTWQR